MANAHRTNALVTACFKTPVDPQTKAPMASYERERVLPCSAPGLIDNRDYEKELDYEESESDFCEEDYHMVNEIRAAAGDRLDLSEIFFSNEEYYSKLEELKKAHLRTMAELESMYRTKLLLRNMEPLDGDTLQTQGHRFPCSNSIPAASCLRKSHSAVELRRGSRQTDSSEEDDAAVNDVEKGLQLSPKEHIKNMWSNFKLSPHNRHLTAASTHSLPGEQKRPIKRKGKKNQGRNIPDQDLWKHRVTVPKPFHMTLREAERRKHGVKTRTEIEQENAELRRQLEDLTECQRKFRASPVPAHVHLPLYGDLRERSVERRRTTKEREDSPHRTVQKPFSFLERERLKKEQKQLHSPQQSDQEKVKPFKAKPVPKAVYAAASGEHIKEEQLYRSIKIQMRAEEMLHSASVPPSMLARRLSERKRNKEAAAGVDNYSHSPHINKKVPDFDASYRRFQKHLEKQKEVKPTTACEPFELRTSQITSHRDRILADIEKEQSSPRLLRWPHINTAETHTPNSSLCSSLSGSLEVLPSKATDATKKRHEATSRKLLEQRRKAEEEEERWKERQKRREKKLQRVVVKRAQANDPHTALSQTQQTKLKEFRKQDNQRKKEYQQEIKEMKQRVKGRPLLLEQVAQTNAKQTAEKRYTDALHGCDLTEEFVSSKAVKAGSARRTSPSTDSRQSEEPDVVCEPVTYRKVFLDDEDDEVAPDKGEREKDSDEGSYHYSDDHENYSDDSEHDIDTKQQEAGD